MSEELAKRLKNAARSGDREALEEVWLEAMEDPGPPQPFLDALDALATNRVREISLALLPMILEIYEGMDRHLDALSIVRRMAGLQPDDSATRRALLRHLKGAYKGEEWFEPFLNASKLQERIPLDEGLRLFDAFAPYKTGAGVEHGGGWGIGIIKGFNDESWDVKVRFDDGFPRELPLTSAVDSLKPLGDDDFRVMIRTRPEEVQAMAKDDPAQAIRCVLALQRGKKLNAHKIKEALVDQAVPAKEWARWWTRAKKAAAQDPWLQVEGGSRPIFQLRDRPVTIEEEAQAAIESAPTLIDAVRTTRDYLAARPDDSVKTLLLETVGKRVEEHLPEREDMGALFDGVLLLEEYGHQTSVASTTLFQEEIDDEDEDAPELVGDLINEIAIEKGRSLALASLQKAFPGSWPVLVTGAYDALPKDLLDPAAEALIKKKHGALLVEKFRELMGAPWRHPLPIYYLSRRQGGGGFDKVENAPDVTACTLAMLKCLESSLFHTQNDKYFVRDVIKKYEELFFDPKRKLLHRFVEQGTKEQLSRAISMVHITSQLPGSVQDHLTSEIAYRYPDLVEIKETPFWEEDFIYCTREGIDRRNEELRVLTEEKLPEIFKAIGKAADFGDLSENAEWTAALEEQRLLTEKAGQIEQELGMAKSIEDQRRPEDQVTPGTRVTLQKLEDGTEETFSILGPWDGTGDGVISYKAPYAASLLGAMVGEEVTVQLPSDQFDVKILAVEIL